MLRRKYSVQKSFRIDAQLSEDLETLSEILDRPQNDLVNTALEELMVENKEWFIKCYLIEKLKLFFEDDISTSYADDTVSVTIDVDKEKKKVTVSYVICLINQQEIMEYDLNERGKEEIKNSLRNMSEFFEKDSVKIQQYLKDRLNYK